MLPKIAIVHDWLVTFAGAERVLEELLACFPQADIFSVIDFLDENDRKLLGGKRAVTSFIQSLPNAQKWYRHYLPLMPFAIEQLDLTGYDIVISSSHAVAKGVITGPQQLHICFCHSPMRYIWDLQGQYLSESGLDRGIKGWLVRWLFHRLRGWDVRTANGVDEFIAVSSLVRRRIEKYYRRNATVIYPPVRTERFHLRADKDDFYLTVSRMVPYKKIPLIVESFRRMPDKKLVVIGDGPDWDRVQSLAAPNITLLGWQNESFLVDYMQKARAFVFAAMEDFGIVPLEAQACGTPVIAYGKGGAEDTIRGLDCSAPTGVLFREQTVEAIIGAVEEFEKNAHLITPMHCRKNAERFSVDRFRQEIHYFVQVAWEKFLFKK